MPRFKLFAVRDGDVLVDTFTADGDGEARAIELIREQFDISSDYSDDEVLGETDGWHLEELAPIDKEVIAKIYNEAKAERHRDQPWLKADGKTMTKAGRAEALVLLYGIHQGLLLAGHFGIGGLVFLASVRSAEEVLNS